MKGYESGHTGLTFVMDHHIGFCVGGLPKFGISPNTFSLEVIHISCWFCLLQNLEKILLLLVLVSKVTEVAL